MPGAVGHRSALYVNMVQSGCPCPPPFPEFKVPMPPSPILFAEDFNGYEDSCDLSLSDLFDHSGVKPVPGDTLAPLYTSLIISLSGILLVLISGVACGFLYCRSSRRCSLLGVKRSDSSSLSLNGNYPVAKSLWTFNSLVATTDSQGKSVKSALVYEEPKGISLGMAMYGGIAAATSQSQSSPVPSCNYSRTPTNIVKNGYGGRQCQTPLLSTAKNNKNEEIHYMCTPLNQNNFNSPIYEEIRLAHSRQQQRPIGYGLLTTSTSAQSTPQQRVRSSLSCDKTLKLYNSTERSCGQKSGKKRPNQHKSTSDQFTQSEDLPADSAYNLVDSDTEEQPNCQVYVQSRSHLNLNNRRSRHSLSPCRTDPLGTSLSLYSTQLKSRDNLIL